MKWLLKIIKLSYLKNKNAKTIEVYFNKIFIHFFINYLIFTYNL